MKLKLFWLTNRGNMSYRLVQFMLDMCGWKPTHYRRVRFLGKFYNLPFAGRVPNCRRVVGSRGVPLVAFAVAEDCGDCVSCSIPFWMRVTGFKRAKSIVGMVNIEGP